MAKGPGKGKTNNPNGRPAGSQNKATAQAREAIAMFVEGNVDRLNGWLDDIAAENPKDAFDRFMSVVEYHIPKLARTEHQPLDGSGKPTDNKLVIEFVNKNSDTEGV
jgi:hypothetical protein